MKRILASLFVMGLALSVEAGVNNPPNIYDMINTSTNLSITWVKAQGYAKTNAVNVFLQSQRFQVLPTFQGTGLVDKTFMQGITNLNLAAWTAYANQYRNATTHTNIERHISFVIQDPTNGIPYWQPNTFGRICTVKEGFAKCRYASGTGVVSIIRQPRTAAWGTYVSMKTGLGMDTNGEVTTSFTPSAVSNDQQIGIILTYLSAYGVTQACEVELELLVTQ